MSDKVTDEVTGPPPTGTLVPQPHGGALRYGGPGGGGSGRPQDKFRKLARKMLKDKKLVPRLAKIASGEIGVIVEGEDGREYTDTPLREQRGAIETLLKYGVGEEKQLTEEVVRTALTATLAVIAEEAEPELATRITSRLREIWK